MKNVDLTRQKGFTILELVVVIAILGIFALISLSMVQMTSTTFQQVQANTIASWDVRTALRLLREDVKQIKPSYIDASATFGASGNKLVFTTVNAQQISWRKTTGGQLQRRVNSGNWLPVLTNLQSSPFIFLDKNLNVTAQTNNLVYIDVLLNVTQNGQQITVQDRFYVRN
ncbi:MAG TPA: type II secretion system protein [Caldithrix abyssi]|uniref:Type II secretion system protein n=1 Tax=Caldithrix abyssi TaxID=187145 RepID=A0A7V4U0M2_CALAY|nr:type II secretion system protein [Caldithrix abyssi]